MTVTASSFKERFAEFADVADEEITPLIEEADRMHNDAAWGDRLDDGINYYTAHLLCLKLRAEDAEAGDASLPAGPLQKEKVGPLERTFATAFFGRSISAQDAAMSSTPYGLHWQMVLRPVVFAARVAVCL